MYMSNGTRDGSKRTAEMIELLQAEMQHNEKSFKSHWNKQLCPENIREDKVKMYRLHTVFAQMLRKSGMTQVSRVDSKHIMREIGLDPDKGTDVEWRDMQTKLKYWTRPYSPPMPADHELLLHLEDHQAPGAKGDMTDSTGDRQASKGILKKNSLGFFRRRSSSAMSNAVYANEAQMRAQNDTLSGVGRFLNALFRSPSQTQLVQDANQHDRRGSHFYCAISENYMRPRSSIELRDSKQLAENKPYTKQSAKPKRDNSNEKAPGSKREAIKKRDNNREKSQVNNTHDTRKVREPQRNKELVAEKQSRHNHHAKKPKSGSASRQNRPISQQHLHQQQSVAKHVNKKQRREPSSDQGGSNTRSNSRRRNQARRQAN